MYSELGSRVSRRARMMVPVRFASNSTMMAAREKSKILKACDCEW